MLQKHLLQTLKRIDQPRFILGRFTLGKQRLGGYLAVLVNVLGDDGDETLNNIDG